MQDAERGVIMGRRTALLYGMVWHSMFCANQSKLWSQLSHVRFITFWFHCY